MQESDSYAERRGYCIAWRRRTAKYTNKRPEAAFSRVKLTAASTSNAEAVQEQSTIFCIVLQALRGNDERTDFMLRELYFGKVIPWERKNRKCAEQAEIVKKIEDEEKYFVGKIPLDDTERFQQLSKLYSQLAMSEELALEAIKSVSGFVKSNEAEFIKQVRETSEVRQEETAKSHKKRIAKEQKRVAELDALIRRIYEDNINGKLTDKRFHVLSVEYENEQRTHEAEL